MAHPHRQAPGPEPAPRQGLTPTTRKRILWTAVALVVVGLLAWLVLGQDDDLDGGGEYAPVSGFQDVHGLAVDPERPEWLYIATHHGLIRAENDTGFARVGDLRHDYMGFTAHPTQSGTFWVSGHPSGGGNMGVRHSTDGGFTWQQLALAGRADFHAMTVSPADPANLWGFYASEVHRSRDGGHSWAVVGTPPDRILSLAGDPEDPEAVHAASLAGLLTSRDGGASWQVQREGVHTAIAVHASAPVRYTIDPDGVLRSADGGATWQRTSLEVDGTVGYLALHPDDPDVLYAATFETGIHKSTDGGDGWRVVKAPSG